MRPTSQLSKIHTSTVLNLHCYGPPRLKKITSPIIFLSALDLSSKTQFGIQLNLYTTLLVLQLCLVSNSIRHTIQFVIRTLFGLKFNLVYTIYLVTTAFLKINLFGKRSIWKTLYLGNIILENRSFWKAPYLKNALFKNN